MAKWDQEYYNRDIRLLSESESLRMGWHPAKKDDPEYRERILPCYKASGHQGYWWGRGKDTLGYYHPNRKYPDQDFARVVKLAPAAVNACATEEVMFWAPREQALSLMHKGPKWCRVKPKRLRPRKPVPPV